MTHRYRLFDIEIASDRALALRPSPMPSADPGLYIRTTIAQDDAAFATARIVASGAAVTMTIAGVAQYCITGGTHIDIHLAPRAAAEEVDLFLLGSAMGLALQQRGLLVLHANAVSDGERALAFAGPSGAGKSTLAAHLVGAGATLLSDDLCACRLSPQQAPVALPGLARFRLTDEARAMVGARTALPAPTALHRGKHIIPAPKTGDATPLAGIYILRRAKPGQAASFRRLSGPEAMKGLMENSYRGQYLDLTGTTRHHFDHCIAALRSVPIFAWHRRWSDDPDEALSGLHRHARAQTGFGHH